MDELKKLPSEFIVICDNVDETRAVANYYKKENHDWSYYKYVIFCKIWGSQNMLFMNVPDELKSLPNYSFKSWKKLINVYGADLNPNVLSLEEEINQKEEELKVLKNKLAEGKIENLKKLAIIKGLIPGVYIYYIKGMVGNVSDRPLNGTLMYNDNDGDDGELYYEETYNNGNSTSYTTIYSNGEWAKIVEKPKFTIKGYNTTVFDNNEIGIGCETFSLKDFEAVCRIMNLIKNGKLKQGLIINKNYIKSIKSNEFDGEDDQDFDGTISRSDIANIMKHIIDNSKTKN